MTTGQFSVYYDGPKNTKLEQYIFKTSFAQFDSVASHFCLNIFHHN